MSLENQNMFIHLTVRKQSQRLVIIIFDLWDCKVIFKNFLYIFSEISILKSIHHLDKIFIKYKVNC